MNERIDHAAKARVLETNAWARGGVEGDRLIRRPEERRDMIASAQVHALLALVEQQRIQNLIALHRHEVEYDLNGDRSLIYENGTEALRPEVAAALGLEGVLS